MNGHATFRRGWLKYGLLLALAACGGVGGMYLSGEWSERPPATPAASKDDGGPAVPSPSHTHRFALTARDAKDTIESPELTADSAGRVFLTWASKTGEAERTVFFTRTIDSGRTFDAPRALSKGGVFRSRSKGNKGGYERRATPHAAVAGEELHLAWSEASADGAAMRFLLATSTDAGATFGPARPVHHAPEANPTFTALGVGRGAEVVCAWLGGSAGQQPFAAVRRAGASSFEEERLIHPGQDGKGVCPCCPMAACFAADGTVYVAFRNIADGYRDIAIGALKPGQTQFEGPFPVAPPTWKFNGCPHDGPSMALLGDRLHIVWMDAHSGSPRCYHGQARLADMKFTAEELHPIPVVLRGTPNCKRTPPAGCTRCGRKARRRRPPGTRERTSTEHPPQHPAPAGEPSSTPPWGPTDDSARPEP